MRRPLVIAALLYSAAIHAALTPEHVKEMPLLGISFAVAAAAATATAGWLVLAPQSSHAFLAAAALCTGMIVAWIVAVTVGIPFLMDAAEPVDATAVICKLVEAVGAVAAVATSWRRALAGALLGASVLAWLAPHAAANTVPSRVEIPARYFQPHEVTALVGETVTWHNGDNTTHDVTSVEPAFDSGRLAPGESFAFTFARAGDYRYECSIHRFMSGVVHVYALALAAPAAPVPIGAKVDLAGRAPMETLDVVLERIADDGTSEPAATTAASPDGSFTFSVAADRPVRYRARAGTLTSPVVVVQPAPRLSVSVHAGRGSVLVRVAVSPDQAGAPVALERYVRERFDWIAIRRARLGRDSATTFRAHAIHGAHLRVHLLHGVAGYGAAVSRPFLVLTTRTAESIERR